MEFTEAELSAFKSEYAKGATDAQFDLFISECKARNLRPGVHLVFQLRSTKEYDETTGAKVWVKKPFWITTIAALRLIAQRTGEYLGQGPDEYVYLDKDGLPTVRSEIPLPHPDPKLRPLPAEPWAARAKVYRKGFAEPMIGMARFEAYATVVTPKDGGTPYLTETWRKRGVEQLQKCAEALALRKSFAEELGNLFLSEEIKTETEEPHPTAVTPASVVPLPPTAPPVNQQPAVPTDAPRPNEPTQEQVETLVKVLESPVVIQRLAEEGKKIDQTFVEQLKKDVGLTPASQLPPPEKKKGGRPKKENPVNGPVPVPGDITDEDIANAGQPRPVVDEVAEKAAAEAFVADLDPTPTKEEKDGFVARIRALTAKGAKGKDIQARILELSGVTDHNLAPVRHWKQALEEFETKPPSKELGAF